MADPSSSQILANFMGLRDVTNMAMSCRYLNPIHLAIPFQVMVAQSSNSSTSILSTDVSVSGKLPQHMLFDKDDIIFSQGPQIRIFNATKSPVTRGNHKARITCMRLFPVNETSLYQNGSESGDGILLESTSDHFIRL